MAQPLLEARGLTKDFSGLRAVNNVNLAVHSGTIHALIGPNGAGKTTCFNLLTKFLQPTSGSIHYDGREITRLGPAEIARAGVARSFQISATFPKLTVLENVRGALQRRARHPFDMWSSTRSLEPLNGRAMELLEEVGIAQYADAEAESLPYGRKRALEIATTLALEPRLMLLDEPTAGMAHDDVDHVVELIKRVRAGRTILMVEHNLSVVESLCDTITVLTRGEVLAEGDYRTVSKNPAVTAAYIGVDDE